MVVDLFWTTPPLGLVVVVVVVVSDEVEGGVVTTDAGGGTVPYSVVVVVSRVALGPHAEQKPTAAAAIAMVINALHFCMVLYSRENRPGCLNLIDALCSPRLYYREGTFAPDLRASDRPIAIACLRLFTFLPDFPDFSLPRFISCIARPTLEEAFLLYFRDLLFVAIVTNRKWGGFIPCAARSFVKSSAAKVISLVVFSRINGIIAASQITGLYENPVPRVTTAVLVGYSLNL